MKLIRLLFVLLWSEVTRHAVVAAAAANIIGGPSSSNRKRHHVITSVGTSSSPTTLDDEVDVQRLINSDSKSKISKRYTALVSKSRGGGGGFPRPKTTTTTPTSQLRRFGGTLLESAMYGFLFATLALLSAGWIDWIFPSYNPTKQYTTIGLFVQVALQAGANTALAQAAREFIQWLPLPDFDGSDKALPAAGGGVVFGFFMFSRQSNWKSKVAALDAMLDKTWLFP